jgi:signal transduction histidine kinase
MKILHLEDCPSDAELTHTGLREIWPDCEIQVVSSSTAFQAALATPPDIILSDFNIPGYNGLEALRQARAAAPSVPFIFLSGTIGEERALEALRAGAADYVIKDRPKRLIPAMQRALHDVQLQRERRAAEEQMQRVQRLENIGMLAAGIAHDFNNVLAPVLMGLSLLRMRFLEEADQQIITSMEKSAARGAGLVKQILGFAHGVTGGAQLVQPAHLIKEIIDLARQTFPKNITIEEEKEARLWPIRVNPTQFHQVLLNLCVNARDAMPGGGTLTVRAVNRTVTAAAAAALPDTRPGDYVEIEVRDSGTGIPPEILASIWEPFFTTKGAGKGTGLGLSTVRGIIKQHEGVITVQSQPGRGTAFSILFPALAGAEVAGGMTTLADVPRGRGELVLLADDDASVREIATATLTCHGYRVLSAIEGTEAVARFAPRCLEVRAVVADMDMPNLDGVALAKIVQALNPATRIILASGFESPDGNRQIPDGVTFLAKPFTGETLLRTLHGLLNQTPAAE